MKNSLMKAYVWAQIWRDEHGQDLVEYALVVALIAFAAIVGMNNLATQINSSFSKVGSKLISAMGT